jgi:hypothetical protein
VIIASIIAVGGVVLATIASFLLAEERQRASRFRQRNKAASWRRDGNGKR